MASTPSHAPAPGRSETAHANGRAASRRIRVAAISHAYIAEENRKNIEELAKYAEVRVVMPRDMSDTILTGWLDERGRRHRTHGAGPDLVSSGLDTKLSGNFRPYRRLKLFGAQYFLASWSLGLGEFEPDIVHVDYDPWATIFLQALLAKRLFAPRAKLVVTSRKNTYRQYPGLRGRLKHRLAAFGVHQIDHLHAEGVRVAGLYMDRFGLPAEKISTWPQLGIDLAVFHPHGQPGSESERPLIVGFVGRFDDDKGIFDLLDALSIVRQRTGVDIELHCLGHGRRKEQLDAEADRASWLKLFPRVPHDQVPEFFRRIDVYVMPSRITPDHEEHDAHALIEAMAFGLPSIGTRCGIIPELLGDGSGLLCDSSDPQGLADALERLVRRPALRTQLGQRALTKAQDHYSIEAVAKCRIALYERLLRLA